jgi:hypothetical protein
MYKLNGIMRQGTIDSSLTSARYATLEEARAGARELLRDDRVLRAKLGGRRLRLTDTQRRQYVVVTLLVEES